VQLVTALLIALTTTTFSQQQPAPAADQPANQANIGSAEIKEDRQRKIGSPPVTYETLFSVVFPTPLLGWAVGERGTILHTEDGGMSWKTQASGSSVLLSSVAFAAPQSGSAAGDDGTMLHTEDGGQTWKAQTKGSRRMQTSVALAFTTAQLGWAVDGNTIVHTEDGGRTWTKQASDARTWLRSVAFVTPQSGWAVGLNGAILHTEDGGQSWKTQASGITAWLRSVTFATSQSVWVVGDGGTILHTEDGGQSWTAQISGSYASLTSVAFVTPQSGWVVGTNGTILHTEDGGQSWKSQTSGSHVWLTSVACATSQSIWVVGEGGTMIHTDDGGQTWANLFEVPVQRPSQGSETTPSLALTQEPEPEPKMKTSKIKEGKRYKGNRGLFSITVPPRNWAVDTYELKAFQLKQGNNDYEEVVFLISDFGQAYGAGVHRIPAEVLTQMAREEEKQTLSSLANKALHVFRGGYAEEPEPVEDTSLQTQFGAGLLRTYLARRSSLIEIAKGGGKAGDLKGERADCYVAVLVVKKGNLFIYATAEDDDLKHSVSHGGGEPSDPKPILRKKLQDFFGSMAVE